MKVNPLGIKTRGSLLLRLAGAKEQDGDADAVLDAGCGRTQEEIP